MGGECFNCSENASERYTLVFNDPEILEDKLVCDACVSDFQSNERVEVHKGPVFTRGGESMSTEKFVRDEPQEVDKLLSTLSNAVRREVINYFENHVDGTTASLGELVTHIEGQTSAKTSENLWTTLYQVHLPTLQSRGWLEFETQHHSITYYGHPEAANKLERLRDIFSS